MKKLSILLLLLLTTSSIADDYLKSWIPSTCCVTNDCCWEISKDEIREVNNEEVMILSTGQVKKKQYSPDGKYYRCACNYDNDSKTWIKHQGANTRCIFVPQPNS